MAEHRLPIFDYTFQDEHHTLTTILNDSGDLVLEGYDLGDSVEQFWGDSDYEYWRVLKNFSRWLAEKGIPSEFGSWA